MNKQVLPQLEVRKKNRKKFNWENRDRKSTLFGYSTHENAIRYCVCGVYNAERNSLCIGVTRTDGKDNFCRADGREKAYVRATGDSSIEIAVKGRAVDYFRYLLGSLMTPAMVVATITTNERKQRKYAAQVLTEKAQLVKAARKLIVQERAMLRKEEEIMRPIEERVVVMNTHSFIEEVI